MKAAKYFLISVALLLLNVTCQKVEGPAANIFKTWEVKEFVSIESTTYKHDENTPIFITINENQTYSLQLEKNTCTGQILHINELWLIMEAPACTEMCCDSPFSSRFGDLIPFISMYKVTGTTLRLFIKDWGFIECELIN